MLQASAWLPRLWCHDPQPTPFPFKSLKLKDILLSQPIFPSRMLRALKPVIQEESKMRRPAMSECLYPPIGHVQKAPPIQRCHPLLQEPQCHGNRITTVGRTRWQASTSKNMHIPLSCVSETGDTSKMVI